MEKSTKPEQRLEKSPSGPCGGYVGATQDWFEGAPPGRGALSARRGCSKQDATVVTRKRSFGYS